ncbi:hypothetical protein EON65_23290, partial [archaeon]
IGVILTGLLDDGTSGMQAIKKCGGTVVVQDPKDALFPDMAQHVINNVEVDYCVPLSELGALLAKIVHKPVKKDIEVPAELLIENEIATRVISPEELKEIGEISGFICPDCGGPLADLKEENNPRFRCFTGHTYSAHTDSDCTCCCHRCWDYIRTCSAPRCSYSC